jgi:hypothetical protein
MRPIAHINFLSGVYTLLAEFAELRGINTIVPGRPEDISLAVKLDVILLNGHNFNDQNGRQNTGKYDCA